MIAAYLRRGMAAGLLAGLLAGLFAFSLGEPSVDEAIQIEKSSAVEQHGEVSADGQKKEVLSRSTQKLGLFFTTGLFGVTVGGLFGLTYAYFRGRLLSRSEWNRSLSLAGAIFVGAFLVPFVKYPANPPSVGDPATIGDRTASYLAMVALSLLVVLGAWYIARTLRERGTDAPVRQLTVGLGAAAAVGVLFLALPAAPEPAEFPSGLLWSFRLSSLGTEIVFWTSLGAIFGLLCERVSPRASLES